MFPLSLLVCFQFRLQVFLGFHLDVWLALAVMHVGFGDLFQSCAVLEYLNFLSVSVGAVRAVDGRALPRYVNDHDVSGLLVGSRRCLLHLLGGGYEALADSVGLLQLVEVELVDRDSLRLGLAARPGLLLLGSRAEHHDDFPLYYLPEVTVLHYLVVLAFHFAAAHDVRHLQMRQEHFVQGNLHEIRRVVVLLL